MKPVVLSGNGPASYSIANADVIYNPGSGEYLNAVSPCTTQSGAYNLIAIPVATGQVRAGAPSPSQSGFAFRWFTSGLGAVTSVTQNVAGSGMTPGVTVPITFSGNGGAAGTVTVLTATTIQINLTKGGSYTSTPTATVTGTGGTPPTLTVGSVVTTVGQVADGTNLSAESVQFGAIISAL
jgi:hypothetical protein